MRLQTNKGFTLVEMVTVIIILGILVVGVSSFVILGTRIFVESSSVDQVLSQSRFVIERMTRELRNALPNSIRVASSSDAQCIEFMPITASASYISLPIAPDSATDSGSVMLPAQGINLAHKMVIYPLSPAQLYQDSPSTTQGRIFDVKQLSGNQIEFNNALRFDEASPQKRYFIVNGAVSYCFLSRGDIRRYDGYGVQTTQPTPAQMGTGALMGQHVVNNLGSEEPIHYTPGTLVNNAVVQLSPRFEVNGQTFQYQHQVQVINVP
ncbi:PilW family protein [Shewanella loihica]|uniref:Methylation site containing protein n=1 Tax=Shewanella loihica (strain ATCC BAA-1088 / PV-4) TaxID=323850 RepID=A3Q9X4_SHELP|nr:type II secretion system protein [Shewanella loihica]ABO22272.1 methylation site containing protein [Shewanella loihica PV-4]